MESTYFAGVEGGATHSTLIVSNGNGEMIATIEGDGTNHWMVGIPEVAKRIAEMANEAKAKAKIPETLKFKSIGLSLSGCEQDATNISLEKELRSQYPNLSENYVVCSDTVGSILTVSALGGLVVIAGTGSNVFLRNPNGETFQCGGWGHAIGDEGGAWWISYQAVKTVFDHEDNFEKCPYDTTVAWNLIKSHFNVTNRKDMLEYCYASFQKSFYARLCQKMSKAAEQGDELCQKIFIDAGRQLAKAISALLPRVDPELTKSGYLSIICVGSVWLSWELLRPGFSKELNKHNIPYEIRLLQLQPNISMAVGAIYMCADSVSFDLPRDYSKNYEIFFKIAKSQDKVNGKTSNGTNGSNGTNNGVHV
ncbi:unnamed protein product [Diamesa serratosioi]